MYILYLISQAGLIHNGEVQCINVPQLYTTFTWGNKDNYTQIRFSKQVIDLTSHCDAESLPQRFSKRLTELTFCNTVSTVA